ncbi:MAG: site-2 protease family protein [Desulforhopalus sp.]
MASDFYLPYILNYSQPVVEDIVIFCVAMLTAIIVSAEGQGFVATLLGDAKVGAKDRFHFNVFLHMTVLGTLNFFIAGFGWAKELEIDTSNFKNHPRLYLVLSRMAGPLANLLMANIAASLTWILSRWGFVDSVFSTIVVVNVTMAVYGLIIIAPLPGSALLFAFFPHTQTFENVKKIMTAAGPYVIVLTFLIIRMTGWDGVSSIFNPIVSTVTSFILNG